MKKLFIHHRRKRPIPVFAAMKLFHNENLIKLFFVASLFINSTAHAQTCPINVNGHPGVVGTWIGEGRDADGNATEEIALKFIPGRVHSFTSCKWVIETGGFPFFGKTKREVCTPVTECIPPYIQATIRHFTKSINEVDTAIVQGKTNGDWLFFDVQSDNLLRFWVKPKFNNNVIGNKELDYVLWTFGKDGSFGEQWIPVRRIK